VVTVHDLSVFDHPSDYPPAFGAYLRWRIQRAVRAADGIHCVSHDTRQRIAARWPETAKKCRVIPCGVDDFFFADSPVSDPFPPLPNFFILTVGAGQPRKNAQFGAEIVRLLRAKFRLPCEYVVVGHDASLPPWVHQYPVRAKRELVPFYKRAALLLMPSTHEGFGIPALEAMAAGCPVAVSNRGAMPEVVGDAAVLIFALEDGPEKAAARLAEIFQDKDLIETKRELGRKRAYEFTWRSSAIALRQFFEDLVQKKEAGRG
jgi:alpha-1,3-rhamnosyl/mannosyltransferase